MEDDIIMLNHSNQHMTTFHFIISFLLVHLIRIVVIQPCKIGIKNQYSNFGNDNVEIS